MLMANALRIDRWMDEVAYRHGIDGDVQQSEFVIEPCSRAGPNPSFRSAPENFSIPLCRKLRIFLPELSCVTLSDRTAPLPNSKKLGPPVGPSRLFQDRAERAGVVT
jgi:hypothetical protein